MTATSPVPLPTSFISLNGGRSLRSLAYALTRAAQSRRPGLRPGRVGGGTQTAPPFLPLLPVRGGEAGHDGVGFLEPARDGAAMSEAAEGPLAGLLVVSVEQAVAAPFATMRLADAGARVIKVERAEGDFARYYDRHVGGECAWFVWLNRGKESVVLDIKDAGDNALLAPHRRQGRTCSCRTSRPARRHARASIQDTLRRRHPRLITCDISGYGESGPYAADEGLRLPDPVRIGDRVGHRHARSPRAGSGSRSATSGRGSTPTARSWRRRSAARAPAGAPASGSRSSTAWRNWMTVPLLHLEHGGKAPARTGLSHAMIAPYGAYPVGLRRADGDRDPERARVGALLRTRSWAMRRSPPMRASPATRQGSGTRPELDALIVAVFGQATTWSRWRWRCGRPGIAFGRLNDVAGLSAHPQLRRAAGGDRRRHGRDRRTPRPPRGRRGPRPPPPPRPVAGRAQRGDPGGIQSWR